MSVINTIIGVPLGYLMWLCYILVHNYALAIIFFTLLTKFILLPIAVKVQKNSIKMVEMQPRLNEIAAKYAGDKDQITDEQMKLYSQEKYSPAAGCLPMLIQIPIILGLIQVIYNPLQHLLHLSKDTIQAFIARTLQLTGLEAGFSPQIHVVEAVQDPAYYDQFMDLQVSLPGDNVAGVLQSIQNMDMSFLGLNLTGTPSFTHFNNLWWIPTLAGLTALALCLIQNRLNVLQIEQGAKSQWGMTVFLTGFSLYFTFVVPAGVGLYWIFSNFFSILQLFLLNHLYDPKKYIDYEALEKSKLQLAKSKARAKTEKKKGFGLFFNNPHRRREKSDYKRFFAAENKQLVFYSEKSGFYKYFENVIDEIIARSDIVIHYVTSDPDDAIFAKDNPRIIPYYIGEKRLIPFMMKMDADMVVMTMPDLEQFHIKRSLVREDVEYVYMFHWVTSVHMVVRQGAIDHYDTVFCVGPHQVEEIRETEKLYSLPAKKLISYGYSLIDSITQAYEAMEKTKNERPQILIAPSWQADNIMDCCLDTILAQLQGQGCRIIVRPHPQYVQYFESDVMRLRDKYLESGEITVEIDFSSNQTVYRSDLLITDWSSIAYEFSFATKKPTLFINTPMKVINSEYTKLSMQPTDITWRDEIGKSLELDDLDTISAVVAEMLQNGSFYRDKIIDTTEKCLYNFGCSAATGADYIIGALSNVKHKESS